MRKGRWISIGLTVGVGLMLGLNSGWVSAEEPKEEPGEAQQRGVRKDFRLPPTAGIKLPDEPFFDLVPIPVQPANPSRGIGPNCVTAPGARAGGIGVWLVNIGTVASPATAATIVYVVDGSRPGGTFTVQVPPVNAGTMAVIGFPHGSASASGNSFTATLNTGHVPEGGFGEINNTLTGYCPLG